MDLVKWLQEHLPRCRSAALEALRDVRNRYMLLEQERVTSRLDSVIAALEAGEGR